MNNDAYFSTNSNTYYIILFIFLASLLCILGFIISVFIPKSNIKKGPLPAPEPKSEDQKL